MEIPKDLLSLLLPGFLVDHFSFITSSSTEEKLRLYFEEKNIVPDNFRERKVESKGFHKEIIIEDFPLRGKLVYLHLKRRRWRDVDTEESCHETLKPALIPNNGPNGTIFSVF